MSNLEHRGHPCIENLSRSAMETNLADGITESLMSISIVSNDRKAASSALAFKRWPSDCGTPAVDMKSYSRADSISDSSTSVGTPLRPT